MYGSAWSSSEGRIGLESCHLQSRSALQQPETYAIFDRNNAQATPEFVELHCIIFLRPLIDDRRLRLKRLGGFEQSCACLRGGGHSVWGGIFGSRMLALQSLSRVEGI